MHPFLEQAIWKILGFAGVIIAGFLVSAGSNQRIRSKKREQHRKSIQFKEDTRPLILYLRSFSRDGLQQGSFSSKLGITHQFPLIASK